MQTDKLMTRDPITLSPRATIARAVEEMTGSGIRHLPLVDAHHRLVGVVSERDLMHGSEGGLDRPLSEIMRTDLKTVSPDTPAHEAAYLLLRHRIGCVPVVETDGRVVGIVTETDFVRVAYTALGGAVPVDELETEEREAEDVSLRPATPGAAASSG